MPTSEAKLLEALPDLPRPIRAVGTLHSFNKGLDVEGGTMVRTLQMKSILSEPRENERGGHTIIVEPGITLRV